MEQSEWLAERFEQYRTRLRAVAYRMLGSPSDADDAVQEAWIRFSRTDTSDVENLGSWLTTVVSRVCLNMLQARRTRPEPRAEEDLPEFEFDAAGPVSATSAGVAPDPEREALLADSVGLALLVVLDSLAPPERVALVLHDMFGVPFDEIGPIVGRSEAATRQLASRARRRVRGQEVGTDDPQGADGPPGPAGNRFRQAALVDAFLAAARRGNFNDLLTLLDPDVVMRADGTAVELGAPSEVRGATAVATFTRRARGAQGALVDGQPAMAWAPGGEPRVVYRFTVSEDRIVGIDLVANPDTLAGFDLVLVDKPAAP